MLVADQAAEHEPQLEQPRLGGLEALGLLLAAEFQRQVELVERAHGGNLQSLAPVTPLRPLPARPDFPKLEEAVLERWRERDVFRESVRRRQGAEPYVFYEGPPTANGRPGSHHVFARAFKDIFPRYQTMRGRYVERKGGWDCHGLPVEIAVEQKLGFKSKDDIERFGIAEFNAKCRESVFEYLEDWNRLTERIGYWVDLEHPYRTLEPELRRVGLVGAEDDVGARPALRGPQGRAVLRPLRHRAVLARGLRGLPGRRGPERLRHLPGRRRRRSAAARRQDPGLDHDAVDAALQRRAGRLARPRVRAQRGRPRDRRGARRSRARRGRAGSPTASTAATCSAPATSRRSRSSPPRSSASAATPSCRPTSSAPRTAPASCTPRSRSARTTSGSARSRASPSSTP